jgi:hypothetical protein
MVTDHTVQASSGTTVVHLQLSNYLHSRPVKNLADEESRSGVCYHASASATAVFVHQIWRDTGPPLKATVMQQPQRRNSAEGCRDGPHLLN